MPALNEGNGKGQKGRRFSALRRASDPVVRQRTRGFRCRPSVDRLENRTLLSVSIINGGGLGYAGNGSGGPPDVTGAAGPNSYLEITNDTVTLFSPKLGGTILAQHGISDFFYNAGIGNLTKIDPTSRGVADSTGTFDNLMGTNGRFIIGDIDIDAATNVSQYIFAVSTSSNPTTFTTADWNFYHITTTEGSGASQAWTDYPGNPGYNADAFVETFNMAQGGSLTGNAQIVSVSAADLTAGVSQASLHVYHNDISGSTSYRPTTMHDSVAGDPMWLLQNPGDGSHINVDKMTNVLSNSATFNNTSLSLPAADTFDSAGINNPLNPDDSVLTDGDVDNPDSSPASDVDSRILKAGEYNNTIVAAHKVAVGSASVASASVQINMGLPVGGSGYTVGDILTATGGTFTTAATLKVATLGPGGSVATVTVANPGNYSSLAGLTGAVTGGTGSGAKFSFNFRGQLDVQWYAISVSGGTPAFQLVGGSPNIGRIGFGANTYSVEPAIDINSKGEIGLGFMESDTVGGAVNAATGGFLSTFVTARLPTDPAGTMQPVVLVPAGTGSGNINGRIGDFSGMNPDPVNGTFWHVNEFGGGGPTDIANFTPEAKPTVTAPSDQTAVEGASKSFSLGSFADADGSPWTVNVDWGDGAHDSFLTLAAGSLGSVAHKYAEEGNYTPKVTVTDSTNLSDSATFNVAVSDPAVIAAAAAVNAVEGQSASNVTVATFTDPGGAESLANYSAQIDWGDGTTTSGAITFAAGTFTVAGTHTYAEESAADHPGSNPYQLTVTISHGSASNGVAHPTATVSDPAVTPTGGFTFNAVEGMPSATQTVATFTDPGGAEAVGDYSALIDWGDGSTSTGTITLASGTYTVQGSHTYATGLGLPDDFGNTFCGATPPSYQKPITVTISHEAAPAAMTASTATIALPPDSAHLTSDGNLIVVGTTGDDDIQITPVGNTGSVRVSVYNGNLGTFPIAAGDRIIVAALAGNDNIQVAGGVRAPAVLYGGPGDDRIKGGGGPTIEVGCEGNDTLIGGHANDLLIAGDGADRLIGGAGSDILVAGNIVDASLNEDTKFSDLVNVLNGGPVHAVSGGGQDTLTGASGDNTFYYHFTGSGPFDTLTGKNGISIDI